MAVATKSATKPQTKSIEKSQTFPNLELHTWKSRPDEDGKSFERPYVMVTAPFAFIRRWLVSEPYNAEADTGWQRKATPVHIKNLRTAMQLDEFTPTVWNATADEWHVEHGLKYLPVEPGYAPLVNLTVNEDHKLRLTDANHRFEAVKQYRVDMGKIDRQDIVDLIDRLPITIQVSLSPEHLWTDFLRLQKGKGVSRSQLKVMELKTRILSPKKIETVEMATDIAKLLDQDVRSHLFKRITFGNTDPDRPIAYSSLVADHGSSLAWTLYGGALIALEHGKTAEWMANIYIETYQALNRTIDQDDGGPAFFKANQKLCPENLGGPKGGSFLILGVANCLAWRLCYLGDDYIEDEDGKRLEDIAYKTLRGVTGGSAPEKRVDMNDFATPFFSDLKDRTSGKFIPKVDGIPVELIELMSFSTWGVRPGPRTQYQAALKAIKAKEAKEAAKILKFDDEGNLVKRGRKPGQTNKPKPVLTSEYEAEQVLENTEVE